MADILVEDGGYSELDTRQCVGTILDDASTS
jgi:hypothetical protein